MNDDELEVALWKLSVLGPLVSARLEHGDRLAWLLETAERVQQRPDGRLVKLSARTLEAWLYAYRRGGLSALGRKTRSDRGASRAISPRARDLLVRAKRERPRRSIRRLIRMLERARVVRPGELSRSSVHRLLASHGVSRRPPRGPSAERRSFLLEHAGDLWIGDAMHGPRVIAPGGQIRKAYLLSQIDGATRYLPHSYFAISEGAPEQEYGFKQALLKAGRPRTYYIDRGPAYVARSLRVICGELGVHLVHTAPKDCEAKGAIERWHRTWREEIGDELPDPPLPLAELNAIHWAWLGSEYHARRHDTTGRSPREHWLAEVEQLRPLPLGLNLDELFLHRASRKVRKDGTVRFAGGLLEVQPELVGKTVELRFDPSDPKVLPRVFLDGRFLCDTVPLDRLRNATRARRRNLGQPDPRVQPTGLDPIAQILAEHYERTGPSQGSSVRRTKSSNDKKRPHKED
ncbi:MAG: DDE-type integrase/transposase/recombinase [Deltaproteobacteria bacterium]|nr:DDE-type integrase/transposase/recombinase [Deltaproteobacteria bacterium]